MNNERDVAKEPFRTPETLRALPRLLLLRASLAAGAMCVGVESSVDDVPFGRGVVSSRAPITVRSTEIHSSSGGLLFYGVGPMDPKDREGKRPV
ncbi:hypothetical protein TNCV_1272921 [Trichonephila clavipes]|nr:hypothetical protein TNCV_1272921 [Trichonephila clavipes]